MKVCEQKISFSVNAFLYFFYFVSHKNISSILISILIIFRLSLQLQLTEIHNCTSSIAINEYITGVPHNELHNTMCYVIYLTHYSSNMVQLIMQ